MKVKIVKSNYDEETGISKVTISTNLGYFTGTSRLHNEDKHISSSFAGCQYAEIKAIIAYLKKKRLLLSREIKGLENCKQILENKKKYNHSSEENRTIRKQIYILRKRKANITEQIENIRNRMLKMMEKRESVIDKISQKRKEE